MINGEKDWKRVSTQKMVTLNNCCDVDYLTFKLSQKTGSFSEPSMPHNTTGSFHSHQRLEGNDISSVRQTSSAFHKVVE